MALKIAVALEAEAADDANDCGGIGFEALGHGAHAEKNVVARMLEYRPNDFLALGAEEFNALRERRSRCLRGNLWSFHGARELPKTASMSTVLSEGTILLVICDCDS